MSFVVLDADKRAGPTFRSVHAQFPTSSGPGRNLPVVNFSAPGGEILDITGQARANTATVSHVEQLLWLGSVRSLNASRRTRRLETGELT